MTTYIDVPDTQVQTDAPVTSTLMTQLRDNPIAMMEGSADAPRLRPQAMYSPLTAGDSLAYVARSDISNTTNVYKIGIDFTFVQSGTIRATLEHRTGGSGTSYANIFLNDVSVILWLTTSSSYVFRSIDIDVEPGEVLSFRHLVTGTSVTSFMRNMAIRTNGEILFPFQIFPGEFTF